MVDSNDDEQVLASQQAGEALDRVDQTLQDDLGTDFDKEQPDANNGTRAL